MRGDIHLLAKTPNRILGGKEEKEERKEGRKEEGKKKSKEACSSRGLNKPTIFSTKWTLWNLIMCYHSCYPNRNDPSSTRPYVLYA